MELSDEKEEDEEVEKNMNSNMEDDLKVNKIKQEMWLLKSYGMKEVKEAVEAYPHDGDFNWAKR